MIDRGNFFKVVIREFGKLNQAQVNGFVYILDKWESSGLTDLRWLAYMLATVWHETGATMRPIMEYGGKEYFIKRYWTNVKVRNQLGNLHQGDAVTFCGKGYVQITGRRNYTKMSKVLYGDYRLVMDPALAMDAKVAADIMFEGMTTGKSFAGDFTGKHLGNYFNKTKEDPINARRIINGLDKAKLIAGYYYKFKLAVAA